MATTKKKGGRKTAKKAGARAGAKAGSKVIKAEKLAASVGVKLSKPLTAAQIRGLRKPLPGYASQLDNAAEALAQAPLGIKDLTPAALLKAQATRAGLVAREQVLYRVWRSTYEQRMQADDEAIAMLQKIARRVEVLSEDEPSLKDTWSGLLDFFAQFHRRAAVKAPDEAPDPTPPEA